MFSSGPNYNKLKTNLRLSCNRLKLLEKKKTETNQKARKEIAGIFLEICKFLAQLLIVVNFQQISCQSISRIGRESVLSLLFVKM
jgi:hypothetical protein